MTLFFTNNLRANIRVTATVFVFLCGCSPHEAVYQWETPRDVIDASQDSQTMVGVAVSDITPPPLRGNAGFSSNGKEPVGMRMPLKARAFYLGFASGPPVVVVQLDLLSGSYLLHRAVSEKLFAAGVVDPAGLVLAGTHSHGGPGNYFASRLYNNWAGTHAGLDQGLFEFLTTTITETVLAAYQSRRPGVVSTETTSVSGLTRNRSMQAYLKNQGVDPHTSPLDATNKLLSVIRLDAYFEGTLRPLGGFASFSIHGTGVEPVDVYHGDLFSFAAATATGAIEASNPELPWQPVFGFINRTHGDNSPNYTNQGFEEAGRIGRLLGEKAGEVYRGITVNPDAVSQSKISAREVDLLELSVTAPKETGLCEPKIGMSLVGGAEDGPTPVLYHLPWFGEGWPQDQSYYECHKQKRVLASVLQPLVVPSSDFPRFALVQLIEFSGFTLVTLPFEITFEAGRRLQQPLIESGKRPENIAVISCSNGYFGYLTTEEEYSQQHYEGGHNLYGPMTAGFFVSQVKELDAHLESKSFLRDWTGLRRISLSVNGEEPLGYAAPLDIHWHSKPALNPVTQDESRSAMPTQIFATLEIAHNSGTSQLMFPNFYLEQFTQNGWQVARSLEPDSREVRLMDSHDHTSQLQVRIAVNPKELMSSRLRILATVPGGTLPSAEFTLQ